MNKSFSLINHITSFKNMFHDVLYEAYEHFNCLQCSGTIHENPLCKYTVCGLLILNAPQRCQCL